MTESKPGTTQLISRYAAAGALGGVFFGALEGIYRFRIPSPPLLRPDVTYVILFLGPLLDGLAAAFPGLLIGLFVASQRSRTWARVSLGVAVCLAALLALGVARNRGLARLVLLGPYPSPLRLAIRAGVVLAGAGAFIAARILPLKFQRIMVGGAFALCLSGVGIYSLNPPMRRAYAATDADRPAAGPNIILITLDTVRADHLSLYGYPRETTPALDNWARQGVVFDNAIAASSWTLPSHSSIFTGLLPHQHGADWAVPLDPKWWTLAEALGARGYETAGFSSNFGYGPVGWGMGNGFAAYDDNSVSVLHNLISLHLGSMFIQPFYSGRVQPDRLDRRNARQINRDVLRWYQQRSPRPFYLFINYYDAHAPYLAPAPFTSHFGSASPWSIGRLRTTAVAHNDRVQLPPEDRESLITGYDNCLAYLDNSVGELLGSLSRLPGWENTIVIITADHGEAFGEHGIYGHNLDLYRETLHVPLMIVGPGIPSGLRISHLARSQELFETVLQLSGMDNAPFLRAGLQRFWRPGYEPGDSDDFVVSEQSLGRWKLPSAISLTTPEWQYLQDERGNEELYRWLSDPIEKTNVAQSPENQKVLKDLHAQLLAAVSGSLHPWKGSGYLAALGGPHRILADLGKSSPAVDSSSAHPSRIPIGTSQAFFVPRISEATQHSNPADEELLQSLPYH